MVAASLVALIDAALSDIGFYDLGKMSVGRSHVHEFTMLIENGVKNFYAALVVVFDCDG